MAKKEYDNVFAKMADNHNKTTVPILRGLNLSTVKIRNTRILKLRDTLEHSESILMSVDLMTEYIAVNSFILSLLKKEDIDMCYGLIKTRAKENIVISANMIYSLVESKKIEIINKLNENNNETIS